MPRVPHLPDPELRETDRPRGSAYWAARWGTSRWTAKLLLAHVHRTLGRRFVWRVGPQRHYVASEASISTLRVVRVSGRMAVLSRQDPPPGDAAPRRPTQQDDRQDFVTEEAHQKAIAAIWDRLRELERRVPRR